MSGIIARDVRLAGSPPVMRRPTAAERAGLRSLLASYLDLADGDALLVVFTEACAAMVPWILASCQDQGHPVSLLAVSDARDATLPARLARESAELAARHRRLALLTLEDDLLTTLDCEGFPWAAMPHAACGIVARITGCVPESFSLGTTAGPEVIRAADRHLISRLASSRHLRLESEGGACLDAEFTGDAAWQGSLPAAGQVVVLPAGGVRARPARLDGVFIASGAVTVNRRLDLDIRLADYPVTVVIDDSRIASVSCDNAALEVFLRRAIRIGDTCRADMVTIGGNPGVTRYVSANNCLNRRHPGLHLTFGRPDDLGPARSAGDIRIDVSTSQGRVIADGEMLDPCALETMAS